MMQCFLLAVNHFKHYNTYTTDQIIRLIAAVQHLRYEIKQSFLRLCFMGGVWGWGKRSVCSCAELQSWQINLLFCFRAGISDIFITAATYLPILEGNFSFNVRKNSKF